MTTERHQQFKTVKHGQSTSTFDIPEDGVVHLKRKIKVRREICETDAFGGFWMFGISSIPSHQLAIGQGSEECSSFGPGAILVPPFNVVRWRLYPGTIKFSAYFSCQTLPGVCQDRGPLFFPFKTKSETLHLDEIIRVISDTPYQVLLNRSEPHIIVKKTKDLIDLHFDEDLSMTEIADQIKTRPAVMTRYFRDWYGIPPTSYRTKLRVFAAKYRLLNSSRSVSTIAMEVGFNDLSQYNRQFKKVISGKPTDFRL